jgi:hypothetical protein
VYENLLAWDHPAGLLMEESREAVSDAIRTTAAWTKFRLFGIGKTFLAETRTNSA